MMKNVALEEVNALNRGTMMEVLGIEILILSCNMFVFHLPDVLIVDKLLLKRQYNCKQWHCLSGGSPREIHVK